MGLKGMRQLERLSSKFYFITVHADVQRCIVRGRVHHELSKGTDDRIRVAWSTTSAVAKQTLARELQQLHHQGWRSTQVAVKLGSALMYVAVITQLVWVPPFTCCKKSPALPANVHVPVSEHRYLVTGWELPAR